MGRRDCRLRSANGQPSHVPPKKEYAVEYAAREVPATAQECFRHAHYSFDERGRVDGIQTWVALPKEHEETKPAFAHYASEHLPIHEEAGLWMRFLAGDALTPAHRCPEKSVIASAG